MEILDYWQQFRAYPQSDLVLFGVGGIMLIFSVLKIVKSSFVMLFWVVLSGLGLTSISIGLDQNPLQFATANKDRVDGYLDAGKELSADALQVLCRKLDENADLLEDQSLN